MKLYFETKVASSLSQIQIGFNEELFKKLKPPFVCLKVERFDGCQKGDEVHLQLGVPGLLQKWVSHITAAEETSDSWLFIDEGFVLPPPLKKWKHEHRVTKVSENISMISDSISYDCGNPILNKILWSPLWLSFSVRPQIYRSVFGSVQA